MAEGCVPEAREWQKALGLQVAFLSNTVACMPTLLPCAHHLTSMPTLSLHHFRPPAGDDSPQSAIMMHGRMSKLKLPHTRPALACLSNCLHIPQPP